MHRYPQLQRYVGCSKSCRDNTCCCSDKGVALAQKKAGVYINAPWALTSGECTAVDST